MLKTISIGFVLFSIYLFYINIYCRKCWVQQANTNSGSPCSFFSRNIMLNTPNFCQQF